MGRMGRMMLIGGLILLVIVFNFDTTVGLEGGGRVNNIGLMSEKQNYLIVSIAIVFVGIVLLLLGRAEAKKSLLQSQRQVRACPFCAEEILVQAIVCRHCNREVEPLDIVDVEPAKATKNEDHISIDLFVDSFFDDAILSEAINRFSYREIYMTTALFIFSFILMYLVTWMGVLLFGYLIYRSYLQYKSHVAAIIAERGLES